MKFSRINQPIFVQQQGAALMVMMIILVLGSAGLLVSSLGGISQTIKREQKTTEALNQAKEALIAYAATQGDIAGTPRPGDLPCPDSDNDGDSEGACVAGAIGRLPYKTLGIAQLFDSHGESLWYSISGNFRNRGITGANLSSDTNGTLDVYATNGSTLLTSSSDQAVAVVFSPGTMVNSQQRETVTQKNTASNYLETGENSRNNATIGGPFIAGDTTTTFNDKLLYIKASQLRPAIEKRVAGELRKLLESYYAAWSTFPFAVPFTDPNSATYSGSSGTYSGLIPLDSIFGPNTNEPSWNSTPSVSFSDGTNRLPYCELRDGAWNNSRWRCCNDSSCSTNVTIPAGVTVTITGRLNHVGKGFWEPHNIADTNEVRVRNSSGNTALATSVLDPVSVSVTGALNYSDGSATVVFTGKGKAGGSTLQRIELRDITSYASTFPNWFIQNNWQQVMYYATSPGFAPGGTHTCIPYCLSVDNKIASAVVVATSGSLPGNTHPSGTLSNYLEGYNLTHVSGVYETRTISDTFNDTIVTVTP
jgi:type II secretory pathway pseudopilin PulG